MPAIPYNDTAVVDKPWDGPGNEARLKTPIKGTVGKAMYTWYDASGPDADKDDGFPDAKQYWKLPHHEVAASGQPGVANVRGVRAALSRLEQSSTQIPAADKAAVKSHLQKHLDKFNAGRSSSHSPEECDTVARALHLETEGRVWAVLPTMLAGLSALHGRTVSEALFDDLEVHAAAGSRSTVDARGVAVVPLKGVLMPQVGLLAMLFGGASGLLGFQSQIRQAAADPEVSAIVLDVDSPGGLVDMIPEVAADVRAARSEKPVVAVANTMAASAAYWLASQANEVVVTPSGEVGSIGVYQLHKDLSEAHAMRGVNPTLISAGKFKVEGNPYEPLGEDAAAQAQQDVNDYYDMFAADVAKGRGTTKSEIQDGYGQGRSVLAKRAVRAGLADRVDTLEATVRRMGSSQARAKVAERSGEDPGSGTATGDVPEEAVVYTAEERSRLLNTLVGLR